MSVESFIACTHYTLRQHIPNYEGLVKASSSPANGVIAYSIGDIVVKKKMTKITDNVFIHNYYSEGEGYLLDFSASSLDCEFKPSDIADIIREVGFNHQNHFIFSTQSNKVNEDLLRSLGFTIKRFIGHRPEDQRGSLFGFALPQYVAYTFIGDEDELLHSALYVNMMSKFQIYKMPAFEPMEAV